MSAIKTCSSWDSLSHLVAYNTWMEELKIVENYSLWNEYRDGAEKNGRQYKGMASACAGTHTNVSVEVSNMNGNVYRIDL